MIESNQNKEFKGPIKGIVNDGKRILTTIIEIVESRLSLAVAEIEKEKTNLVKLIIMIGLTLLFTMFALISLMILIFEIIDIHYRLIVISITIVILFLMAFIFGIWTIRKSCKSTLLSNTRKELKIDCKSLKKD